VGTANELVRNSARTTSVMRWSGWCEVCEPSAPAQAMTRMILCTLSTSYSTFFFRDPPLILEIHRRHSFTDFRDPPLNLEILRFTTLSQGSKCPRKKSTCQLHRFMPQSRKNEISDISLGCYSNGNVKFENFMNMQWSEEKFLNGIVSDKTRLRF